MVVAVAGRLPSFGKAPRITTRPFTVAPACDKNKLGGKVLTRTLTRSLTRTHIKRGALFLHRTFDKAHINMGFLFILIQTYQNTDYDSYSYALHLQTRKSNIYS